MKSIYAAAFVAAVPTIAHAQPAPDDLARGRELRLAGRPAEAIAPLEAASRAQPLDADVWLNLGLAYAGAERLADAERALAEAQRLAPDYADVKLARARVAYFRGDLAEAERRLAPLLATGGDDAAALAANLAEARRQSPEWRLDASFSRSHLTHDLPDWTRASVALSRRLTNQRTVVASLEHARQFRVDDTFGEAQMVTRRAFLAVGGTPSADFRPHWQVRAGLYTAPHAIGRGWTAQLSGDAAFARFRSGNVRSIQPALTLAKGDSLLVARWINTLDERDEYRSGYAVRALWSAKPGLRLLAGWANAPETSEGFTVRVESVTLGLALDLGADTTLRLDGTREMRTAYDRDELSVGVTRRF